MTAAAPHPVRLAGTELSFAYPGGAPVLAGVDVAARTGMLSAVIGPNGSGKTTLLRLLAGVLRPARGDVHLDGTPVVRRPRRELARQLAYVPQVVRADFPFPVLEVVLQGRHPYLGLLAAETAADRRIAREALADLGLEGLAERSIMTLSAGQQQLVQLAAAFAQTPQVLLLDEPAASLDPAHVRRLFRGLRSRAGEGLAVVAVTHDLNHAAAFADEIVALAGGAVAACGPPEDVLRPEPLRVIYGTDLHVGRTPVSGRPFVLLDP
jgi:iron complex transport system ATP-binding protein